MILLVLCLFCRYCADEGQSCELSIFKVGREKKKKSGLSMEPMPPFFPFHPIIYYLLFFLNMLVRSVSAPLSEMDLLRSESFLPKSRGYKWRGGQSEDGQSRGNSVSLDFEDAGQVRISVQ